MAKRIMIEGGDIKRNERQEADIWLFLIKLAQNWIVIVKLFCPLLYELARDEICM